MSTSFCDPTRHGTHLPQDSLRKNCVELIAMSSMQRPSAHTTIAPDPTIEPASASALKSSGKSTIEAGKYPDDGPDGANPTIFFPPVIPFACLKIKSRYDVPIGTSKTPGLLTSPLIPTNFNPGIPFNPCCLYQSAPLTMIAAAKVNVSTLFSTVGLCHNPCATGNGGLFRGSDRFPSIASISAVSSPQM